MSDLVFSFSFSFQISENMAHSKTRANDGKITYPPGVKEISDKISKEEMVRRLKVSIELSRFLQVHWQQNIKLSHDTFHTLQVCALLLCCALQQKTIC